MNVSTITMDPEQAREKLRHYRAGVHRKADTEWERAAVAYQELAKGKPLIILSDVIAQAPRDEKGRPRLAIARADRKQIQYQRNTNWTFEQYRLVRGWSQRGPRPRDFQIQVPVRPETPRAVKDHVEGYALVPMVPPNIQNGHDLSRHFTLWEVEQWSDRIIGAAPDRDPYLLRRIVDDLYAVVAEWDLTDIERLVMRDRAIAQ